MLLVSSTAPSSSASHSQMFSHTGIKALPPLGKSVGIRGIMENRVFLGVTDRVHSQEFSFKTHATEFLYSHVIEKPEVSDCTEFSNNVHFGDELDDIEILFSKKWNESMGSYPIGNGDLDYVESAHTMSLEDKLLSVSEQIAYGPNLASETDTSGTVSTVDPTVNAVSNNLTLDASINNFISRVNSSLDATVGKGETSVKNTLDAITSSLKNTTQSVTVEIDNAFNSLVSNADSSAELASNRLTAFSNDLKDSISKVGGVSIEVLRQAIVTLEAYLAGGFSLILYYYGSAKELFPPEVKDALNATESRVTEIFGPVAAVFKQIYIAIEVLETNLGLDPNDPILPLFLFLGTSATLWIFYRTLVYGGYAGDLSPQLTLELLTGEKNAVLIDIRPEDLREKDGVPDLRRGARFKYADISLPEIDGSVRKLVKKERDLYDTLTAAVIRNLKIVEDRSKVIVLDADGSRSKSIARSLRKLGVKKPYLVEGGFQSWVKNGLRIKELKPETALTLLNEEAEAILEDIRPTPLKIAGYGMGLVAASYALSEWEKTLQFIGLIGLGQTIYRRIVSYEDSEDFKQDVSLLLGPFRVGATAFSWAAAKLEPNKVGLPTSPSSTDVQSRVQQAAAKHESQPSDSEESAESLPVAPSDNENPLVS